MEKRNSITLRSLLLQYMALCLVVAAGVLCVTMLLLAVATRGELVLPANTAERQAQQAAQLLAERGVFDAALVPATCGYALLDENGDVLETSLRGAKLNATQYHFQTGGNRGGNYHIEVKLQNGICVLQYNFAMLYTNPALNGVLPDFQILLPLFPLLSLTLLLGALTLHYVRRFRHSLHPLKAASQAMACGDLTWNAQATGVREYDEVLEAMRTLQTALGQSLQAQWSLENSRAAQAQALAHDLRTPLTVIAGNAQLLEETALTPE